MDAQTRESWRRVKEHLERVGKTNNQYYKRAVAIVSGMPDPFEKFSFDLTSDDSKR